MRGVTTEPFDAEKGLPLIVTPDDPGQSVESLISWCAENREALDEAILRHGAVLFRGYGVNSLDTLAEFRHSVVAFGGGALLSPPTI